MTRKPAKLARVDRLPASKHAEIRAGMQAARQLLARHDLQNGLDLIKRMLQIEPRNAELYFLAGQFLESGGGLPQAIDAYRQCIALVPGFLPALVNCAACHADNRQFIEAEALYAQALQIADAVSEPVVRANYAEVLTSLRRFGAAIEQRRWLTARRNANFEQFISLGLDLDQADRHEEANAAFLQALETSPARQPIHVIMSTLALSRGERKAAREHLDDALRADPDDGYAHASLTQHFLDELDPGEELTAVERAIEHTADKPANIAGTPLWLAKARLKEKDGDFDAAFAAFKTANDLMADLHVSADEAREQAAWAQARAVTPEVLKRFEHAGSGSEKPLFVTGMPRSGTTLVEQILASHSKAAGIGELELVPNLLASLQPVNDQSVEACAQAYLACDPVRCSPAERVIDKSISTWDNIGAILLMFPRARIVNCQRHPMEVCWSMYSMQFSDDALVYAYDFKRMAQTYKRYAGLMQHWRRTLPGRILDVRYDAIIADPEAEARRLVDHAGLEWEDDCLQFHKKQARVRTASMSQVRQPIYSTSLGGWRRYEAHLGELKALLKDEIAAYEAA